MFSSSSSGLPDILLRWDALPEATVVQGLPRMRAKAGSAPDLGPGRERVFCLSFGFEKLFVAMGFFLNSFLLFYFFMAGPKK